MNDDLCLWSVRWTAGSRLPVRSADPSGGWIVVECLGMAPKDRVWMRASILAGSEATARRMVYREWPDHEALTVRLRLSVHQGRTSVAWVGPAEEEMAIVLEMVARANEIADAEERAARVKARSEARAKAAKARKDADRRRRRVKAEPALPTVPPGRPWLVSTVLRRTPMVTGAEIADILGWDRIKTHLLLLKMEADGLTVRERERWRMR